MLEKIRAWMFKQNVKKTRKYCSKYQVCNDCPFGMMIKKDCHLCEYFESDVCKKCKDKDCYLNTFTKSYYPEEENLAECMLTMFEVGVDRYPYEYEELTK